MIPNIQTSRYETNVSNIQHAFTIEMTPTLAKLLSSQTYSDKTLAAIREPLSNAYDSHVRAGTLDTPVDLHLPTQLEPQFTLRDYGTGLSHDDVIRLFFSYGVSDKRETNNEIGGLGIGAKAFFAYTDQAVITSYFNGQKRVYSANKGASGLPQGMLIHFEDTDEPNGIELSYPVQPQDIETFINKAVSVLTYLELKYKSNVKLTIEKPTEFFATEINGTRVALVTEQNIHKVVMGGIAYNVPYEVYWRYNSSFINFSFLIYLPIGSVEISASRESLSPTEQDKDLITRLLVAFRDKLHATDWTPHVAAAPDWYSAVQVYHQMQSMIGSKDSLTRASQTWRGYPLDRVFHEDVHHVGRYSYRSKKYIRRGLGHGTALHGYVPRRAYWVPKGKKLRWNEWYQANMCYAYNDTDWDVHFTTATIEEAERLAADLGLKITVEDGSHLHVPLPKRSVRSASSSPRRGLIWVDGEKMQLDAIEPERIIYDPRRAWHPERYERLRFLFRAGILSCLPIVVSGKVGATDKQNATFFADYPTNPDAWLQQHPEFIDQAQLAKAGVWQQIQNCWCEREWVSISVLRDDRAARLKFPVEIIEVPHFGLDLSTLGKVPSAKPIIDKIQRWHDKVVPRFPQTIRHALLRTNHYSIDMLLDLYEEMK